MELNGLEVKPTSEWNKGEGTKYCDMTVGDRVMYDELQLRQELPKIVGEFNRLSKKSGVDGGMTEEMVWNMNYFEDFAMELTYYGGVNHAQYSLYGIGAIPANEVKSWEEDELLSH